MKKKIFLFFILIGVGVITISFINTKEKLDIKNIDANKLAVFVKQSDGTYKTETQIPQIGYTLNVDKSTCSNGAKPTWNNNTLSLSNLTSNNTNCYLYFDSDVATNKLKELGLTANTGTPDFSQVATTDEGIYAIEDGMYGGTTYYWRGAATTNYVKFAGYCWRAIRINGDGSIRLIYDGSACHNNGESTTDSIAVQNVAYNTVSDRSEYVGWTYVEGKQRPEEGDTAIDSNVKIKTEEWYNNNIGNNTIYDSKVASGKFCNDREVAEGYSWESLPASAIKYSTQDRIITKKMPILSCQSSDVYALKSGAITLDEAAIAGGTWERGNDKYYLFNGNYYFTISPCHGGTKSSMFIVKSAFGNMFVDDDSYSVRPVINLRSDVTFKSDGNGTIDKPFVVEGAE